MIFFSKMEIVRLCEGTTLLDNYGLKWCRNIVCKSVMENLISKERLLSENNILKYHLFLHIFSVNPVPTPFAGSSIYFYDKYKKNHMFFHQVPF